MASAEIICYSYDNLPLSETVLNSLAAGLPTIVYLHGRLDDVPKDKTPNETTMACLQYLRADRSGDIASRDDAFEHLVGIMLTRTTGLYIPEAVRSPGDDTAKHRFIQEFLLTELYRWTEKTDEQIQAAADAGQFQHLANRCRQRVLNKIRDTKVANHRYQFVAYDEALEEHQPEQQRKPVGPERFEALIAACDFLTPKDAEIAKILFALAHDPELSRSKYAAEIAIRREVSVQTARQYLRDLRARSDAAIKAGHPGAKELADTLGAFILAAPKKPRDAPFSGKGEREYRSALNPGAIQRYPFDGYLAHHRNQDPEYAGDAVEYLGSLSRLWKSEEEKEQWRDGADDLLGSEARH